MLCGNPSGFAFLMERIPEWEVNSWKNGLMFVIVNDDIYPKDVRTTTFNSELPDLLNPDSAFVHPVIDKALFAKNDQEILDYVDNEAHELYARYFIPFHEIEDAGYRMYVISDGCRIRLLVCKMHADKTELVDTSEMTVQEYNAVKSQVMDFYNSLLSSESSNTMPLSANCSGA